MNLTCFGIFSTTLMNDQSLSYLNRMKKKSEIIHISNINIYPHCQNIYMCKTHENPKVTNKIAVLRKVINNHESSTWIKQDIYLNIKRKVISLLRPEKKVIIHI